MTLQKGDSRHVDKSGFLLLSDGLDAFVVRAVLTGLAEKSIDAQYYLFNDDLTGKLLLELLTEAADRGVRVRLLVDDLNLMNRDESLAMLNLHPNFEVRVFNPFSRKSARIRQLITGFGSVTRRMHNKSFTVDNEATVVGGRNIGNEYFEADPDLAFGDLDVLAVGPIVKDVSESFELYWENELAYPITSLVKAVPKLKDILRRRSELSGFAEGQEGADYINALKNSNFAHLIRQGGLDYIQGQARVIYDQPEKIIHDRHRHEFNLSAQLGSLLNNAKHELILFSPYFVPGKEGLKLLRRIREKGVRVRILTNSLASTDVSIVHAGYAKYRKSMLRAGVELFELNRKLSRKQRRRRRGQRATSKESMHAKSFVIDRESVFIGSLNLDPRSLYENTEIGVILESTELAEGMVNWFERNIGEIAFRLEMDIDGNTIVWRELIEDETKAGREGKTFTTDPYTTIWRRLWVKLMALLPIESQL